MILNTNRIARMKDNFGEHFILANIKYRLPHYALLWMAAVLVALLCSQLPWPQPVEDYSQLRAFSIAFMTIAVTTITFAIPTCMRTIFAAYDQYYSTHIKEILLSRFPVTLLTLSAFTSLLISLLVISGILGIAIAVDETFSFYLALFWTAVCIIYLFVAIEKLIYFVVKAPYAVLDKLEIGVFETERLTSKEEYSDFRRELSSMNDIAATILNRSTGRDEAVAQTLEVFRQVHAKYLLGADEADDDTVLKYHLNACRSVTHEIVRMFREACLGRNEYATLSIIRTYCDMLSDTAAKRGNIGYFSEMVAQIPRMRSYASFANVEEITGLAYTNWFFLLGRSVGERSWDTAYETVVGRELSAGLRRATLEHSGEGVMSKFLRIASNSEVEYDMNELSDRWKALLDHSVFLYMKWLIDAEPDHAERYAGYLRKYSIVDSDIFRKVLCDTPERIAAAIAFEYSPDSSPANAAASDDDGTSEEKALSKDKTSMLLSLDVADDDAEAAALFVLFDYAGLSDSPFVDKLRPGLSSAISKLGADAVVEDDEKRKSILSKLVPDYEEKLLEYAIAEA